MALLHMLSAATLRHTTRLANDLGLPAHLVTPGLVISFSNKAPRGAVHNMLSACPRLGNITRQTKKAPSSHCNVQPKQWQISDAIGSFGKSGPVDFEACDTHPSPSAAHGRELFVAQRPRGSNPDRSWVGA